MHELLIGFLIVAIVAIQIYVFSITLEKIKNFKNILPSQDNFKTVKVYIKESDIETISLIDIFKNLHNNNFNLQKIDKETQIFDDNVEHYENEQLKVNFQENINFEESDLLFQLKADKTSIIFGQVVNITFSVNKDVYNFTPEPFDGFTLIKGPALDVSQSSLNGEVNYMKCYNYSLKPLRKGELVIKSASASFNNEIYNSNTLTLNVREY
jgi:hypothetical protein